MGADAFHQVGRCYSIDSKGKNLGKSMNKLHVFLALSCSMDETLQCEVGNSV